MCCNVACCVAFISLAHWSAMQLCAPKAFLGVQLVVQFHFVGVCDKCRGDRSELGYTGNVCPYCEGTGEETIRTGHITARRTCTYCEGSR